MVLAAVSFSLLVTSCGLWGPDNIPSNDRTVEVTLTGIVAADVAESQSAIVVGLPLSNGAPAEGE